MKAFLHERKDDNKIKNYKVNNIMSWFCIVPFHDRLLDKLDFVNTYCVCYDTVIIQFKIVDRLYDYIGFRPPTDGNIYSQETTKKYVS